MEKDWEFDSLTVTIQVVTKLQRHIGTKQSRGGVTPPLLIKR